MYNQTNFQKYSGFKGLLFFILSSYLSFILTIYEECSNIAHYFLHLFLSILPVKAWQPLKVHTPKGTYHPVVLVTGTGSGIGKELAMTLARRGYTVFAGVLDQLEEERLQQDFLNFTNNTPLKNSPQTLKNPAYKGGSLHPIVLDLKHPDNLKKALDAISRHVKEFNIPFVALINNAAHVSPSPLESSQKNEWKQTFEVNLFGAMGLVNMFLPLLRESQGRIINIGSIASWVPAPTLSSYSASKAALHAASSSLRIEVRPFGVGVSLVEPGIIDTNEPNKIEESLKDISSKPSSYSQAILTPKSQTIYKPSASYLYGALSIMSKLDMPPHHVTNATIDALISPWPKHNYIVGWDSKILSAAKWVFGEGLFDVLM